MRLLLLFVLAAWSTWGSARWHDEERSVVYQPLVTTVKQKLGNRTIAIKIYRYGSHTDVVMINLHSNENTSVLAAIQWLKTNGGVLIKIENGEERNITFNIDTATYSFDPNHIFARQGIANDFANNTYGLQKAIEETEKLAKKILSLLPSRPLLVVALHNNFDGDYSIDSYLKGRERASDAAKVYKNPARDADDICLTTNADLYLQLSNAGCNAILQNLKTVKKDGSLSVYCHEKGIKYLNCETEHGKQAAYLQLLRQAIGFIERRYYGEQLITYVHTDSLLPLKKGTPIYKDSVYQGEIRSAAITENGKKISGKFSLREKTKVSDAIYMEAITGVSGSIILQIKSMTGNIIKNNNGKAQIIRHRYNTPQLIDGAAIDSVYRQ